MEFDVMALWLAVTRVPLAWAKGDAGARVVREALSLGRGTDADDR